MPAGVSWPRTVQESSTPWGHVIYQQNTPLHFVAQIDLAEVPWKRAGCPEAGTLLFFARLDEEMQWGLDDQHPHNDVRVIYDAKSSGTPVQPPKDIPPINSGYNLFDNEFSKPEHYELRSFPEWPLVFSSINTIPERYSLPFQVSSS